MDGSFFSQNRGLENNLEVQVGTGYFTGSLFFYDQGIYQ